MKKHGLTFISLARAYHAGKFFAPRNLNQKVVLLENRTVYFAPDDS